MGQVALSHGILAGLGLLAIRFELLLPIFMASFFLGFVQWIYVIPMAHRAKKRGYRNRARGVWIAACVTLGLQFLGLATCGKWVRF